MIPKDLQRAIAKATRELVKAEAASERAMDRRMNLPSGSSRARITTANARWATAAEERDRVAARLAQLWAEAERQEPTE